MESLPLLTLAEVKALVGIRPEVTKDDAHLRLLISAATANIEFATGRQLTQQPFVEHFTSRDNRTTDYALDAGTPDYFAFGINGGGLKTVVKPSTYSLKGVNPDPATLVVHYNPTARDEADYGDAHLLTESDYELDAERGTLTVMAGTRYAPRALRVAYTAGYAAAPEDAQADPAVLCLSAAIPDGLRMAAILQVQFLRSKFKADNIGMGSERSASEKGKVSVSNFLAVTGLTPEVWPYVAHLKRPRVGNG